jgi:cytochrome c oxidase subunit II
MVFGQFKLLPDQASTFARKVDSLGSFLMAVTVVMSLGIALCVIFFAVKYRRRPGQEGSGKKIEGALGLELFWSITPFLIMLVMFFWGLRLYQDWSEPPDDAMEVFVVGRQWMWHLQHTGGQREINRLHVPLGKPVKLTMTSQDVIHSFFVPDFRIHMDVLPGRYTTAWFEATRTGRFNLFCSQYCGTDHSVMIGEVVVLDEKDYATWLRSNANDSLADKGRKLFQKLQCVTCHTGEGNNRAPSLEDIYHTWAPLQDGTRVWVDRAYLRESIRVPDAKIVAGYQPIMPTYAKDLVSEEEMVQVLSFLESLKRGQTPPRVESAEPPAVTPALKDKSEVKRP